MAKKIIKRILIAILIIIVVLVAVAAGMYFHRSSPENVEKYDTTNPFICEKAQIAAHRSGAGILPENTLMALRECVENEDYNPDVFEFDLHMTADGVPVLLHDESLDRVADSVYVFGEEGVTPGDKTYEELRQLNMGAGFTADDGSTPYKDLHGEDVPDELKILSLDDALGYLTEAGDYRYVIEVKDPGEVGMKCVDILYDTLVKYDIVDRVAFGSFNGEVSDYKDEAYPDFIRGAHASEVLDFYISAMLDKDDFSPTFGVLQIPFANAKESKYVNLGTTTVINYAHKHNIAVQYWTIDEQEDMEYLISIGADCIMTDYPNVAKKVVSELEAEK